MTQHDGPDPDSRPRERESSGPHFEAIAAVVIVYAVAMAFLESAVVVYLQRALGIDPHALFPAQQPALVGDLALIEVGREAATLVMLATSAGSPGGVTWSGWRGPRSRSACGTSSTTPGCGSSSAGRPRWDLGPALPDPGAMGGARLVAGRVSLALAGFGLAAAGRLRSGRPVRAGRAQVVAGLVGGMIVIPAFCWNAPLVLDGEVPADFPWPIFMPGWRSPAWGARRRCGRGAEGARPAACGAPTAW